MSNSIQTTSHQNLHVKILSFFFASLPIFLITGPAIPDIILSSMATYFLIITVVTKNYNYYKNYFSIFFLIFFAYSIIRSIFSEYPLVALLDEGAMFYFRYLFFALAIFYIIDQNQVFLRNLSFVIIFCILIIFIDSFYQLVNGSNIFRIEAASDNRISSFMGSEAVLGRYVAFLSSILIYLLICNNFFKNQNIILIFILPISLSIIIISGDRAPLIRYLIFFIMTFLLINNKYRKLFSVSLIITFISSFIILTNFDSVKSRIFDHTISQMKNKSFNQFLTPFGGDYEEIYKVSYKIGLDYPLFGIGPNTHEIYCDKYTQKDQNINCSHPHNFYMQLFEELGLIGFSALFIFYMFILIGLLKHFYFRLFNNHISENINSNFKSSGPLIMIFSFLFPLLPNMSFYNNWNNIFIFMMISLLLKFNKSFHKKI